MSAEASDQAAHLGVKGDSPISTPGQDLFGVDPFAKAIAKSILNADASDGIVYAINGAWGSGKSSAVNLVLAHLKDAEAREDIVVTSFNPWWFSGAEALTTSFFQEMRATVGKSVDEKTRETMATLGSRLSSAAPLLGGIASLFATPAAGAAVTGAASVLQKLTSINTTVEGEHRALSEALSAQSKKFLIVLDDIDRLNTDDSLQIFKLVKSVGRLPNVIYLMAFDRQLAEEMVASRFPAEGASYLDKVVQGAFDLPLPDADDLRLQLLHSVEQVMGAPPEPKIPRFFNLFYDIVQPLIRSPRDTVRLSNAIKVSWPAVEGEVDRADFLAMEALRILFPVLHQRIRRNSNMLTGTQRERGHDRAQLEETYNKLFLESFSDHDVQFAKITMQRLFPRINAIWGNTWYTDTDEWQRDKLVCSASSFRTYFAFGIADKAISVNESDSLVSESNKSGATAKALRGFLAVPGRRRGTRAAAALEELRLRAAEIPESNIITFLTDLFSIADELDNDADREPGGFGSFNNQHRIHWIINKLLLDRVEFENRSNYIEEAAQSASLRWLISLSDRCQDQIHKREEGADDDNPHLVSDEVAGRLYALSLVRLREAAADGSLGKADDISVLLYRWNDRAGAEEVRIWTDEQLNSDEFVAKLAESVISEMWTQGIGGLGSLGDRVTRRKEYVNLKPLSDLVDIERLRQRAAEMAESSETAPEHRELVEHFLRTPERDPSRAGI